MSWVEPIEPAAAFRVLARLHREQYEAYLAEQFTPAQALELVGHLIVANAIRPEQP